MTFTKFTLKPSMKAVNVLISNATMADFLPQILSLIH